MKRYTSENVDKKIIRCSDKLPKTVKVLCLSDFQEENAPCSSEKKEVMIYPVDLSQPMLNSALKFKNHIMEVNTKLSQRMTSESELPCTELRTEHEKITRKVNFPFDKKLYKELVTLNSKSVIRPSSSTSYGPNSVLKDKDPQLHHFYMPSSSAEYNIPVNSNLLLQPSIRQYDGFRISNVMKTWNSIK